MDEVSIEGPRIPRLTREQAAIIGCYTGFLCGPFSDVHVYAERIMGHPIWTHQFPQLREKLKEVSKADFLALCFEE